MSPSFYCSMCWLVLMCVLSICSPGVANPNNALKGRSPLDSGLPLVRSLLPDLAAVRESGTLRVFVDPGHGGIDSGAVGIGSVPEKRLALNVARRLKKAIETQALEVGIPARVKLSREKDQFLRLEDRVRMANEWGADLFVSVHANSSQFAHVSGFEVFFLNNEASNSDALKLAQLENSEQTVKTIDPGILSILRDVQANVHIKESALFAEQVFKKMSEEVSPSRWAVQQAPFTVLAGTQMPALLIELGYLTNKKEIKKLVAVDYLNQMAGAISSGVLEFGKTLKKLR